MLCNICSIELPERPAWAQPAFISCLSAGQEATRSAILFHDRQIVIGCWQEVINTMSFPSVAHLVKRHVRLHAAQRVLERFSAGESFVPLLQEMSPDMRLSVEGLLRAAAESWGNAVMAEERDAQAEGHWLR